MNSVAGPVRPVRSPEKPAEAGKLFRFLVSRGEMKRWRTWGSNDTLRFSLRRLLVSAKMDEFGFDSSPFPLGRACNTQGRVVKARTAPVGC